MHFNIFNVNLRQFSLVGSKGKSNNDSSVTTGITIHIFIFIHLPISQYLCATTVEISKAKKPKKMNENNDSYFPGNRNKVSNLLKSFSLFQAGPLIQQ